MAAQPNGRPKERSAPEIHSTSPETSLASLCVQRSPGFRGLHAVRANRQPTSPTLRFAQWGDSGHFGSADLDSSSPAKFFTYPETLNLYQDFQPLEDSAQSSHSSARPLPDISDSARQQIYEIQRLFAAKQPDEVLLSQSAASSFNSCVASTP